MGAQVRPGASARFASRVRHLSIRADGLQADFARNDRVPFVDVVVTIDETNQAAVFMLNRDLDGEREIVLEWQAPRRSACSLAKR